MTCILNWEAYVFKRRAPSALGGGGLENFYLFLCNRRKIFLLVLRNYFALPISALEMGSSRNCFVKESRDALTIHHELNLEDYAHLNFLTDA